MLAGARWLRQPSADLRACLVLWQQMSAGAEAAAAPLLLWLVTLFGACRQHHAAAEPQELLSYSGNASLWPCCCSFNCCCCISAPGKHKLGEGTQRYRGLAVSPLGSSPQAFWSERQL